MKLFKPVVFLFFIIIGTSVFSQNVTINGYISDSVNGERLIGANVIVNSLRGTVSNNYGYYNLIFKNPSNISITCSFIGHKSSVINLDLKKDTTINFNLSPLSKNIEEIEVYAVQDEQIEKKAEMGVLSIPVYQIKNLPNFVGEPDVLRAFQLMPGVQSGQEGTSGIYVRGGTPDQNLFLLDDVPLYYVNHIGGYVSVFDASILKSVKLFKGGFPARYGGRLSSIVDLRMKDGNNKKVKGEVGVGVILTKLMLEGPIKKDKSSFAFSVRRNNFDAYSHLWSILFPDPSNPNERWGYSFYDMNLKTNFILNTKNRIYFSAYSGNDKFAMSDKQETSTNTYSSKDKISWGNLMFSTRWNHTFNKRLFGNITLAFTRYRYKNKYTYKTENSGTESGNILDSYLFLSGVNDICFKGDLEYKFKNSSLLFGGASVFHTFIPALASFSRELNSYENDSTLNTPENYTKLNAFENYAYVELQSEIGENISINSGIHFSTYVADNTLYFSPQPRLLLNYNFYKNTSVKLSYCYMQQYAHLLTNSNAGLPTDLWMPSTSAIKPETSSQVAIGVANTLKKKYEITIEAYYKKMHNLIEYKEGMIMFEGSGGWENKIEADGIGTIMGIEFLFYKKSGRLTGWFGYTLAKNTREFQDINNGLPFPFKYDRRHDISIVANWKINTHVSMSGSWVYSTGMAITLPTSKYILQNANYSSSGNEYPYNYDNVHIYPGRNGYRLPAYHRLDIAINFTKQKEKGKRTWSLGVYNLYNHQNAYIVYFKNIESQTKLYQFCLMPVFPYVSYSFRF